MSRKFSETVSPQDGEPFAILQEESYTSFIDQVFEQADKETLISITTSIPSVDPLAILEILDDGECYHYYWERPEDEFSIAAGESLLEIRAKGKERFREVRTQINEHNQRTLEYATIAHSHAGIHYLGGFSFFDTNQNEQWKAFGSASFTVPKWQIIKEGRLTLLTLNMKFSAFQNRDELDGYLQERLHQFHRALELNTDRNGKSTPNSITSFNTELPSQPETNDGWRGAVEQAKHHIRGGKFKKIVLARESSVQLDGDLQPTHIANRLRKKYPNCYTFLIRPRHSKTFLGSTPERLMTFKKSHLLTEALAGSMQRGSTATEDAVLEKELLLSTKNASEHNYVVQAIEQRLAPFAHKLDKGSKPVIKKLSNVQHLFTPITAWLYKNIDALTVLEHLHPTPAVGGYPWKQAAPYVQELESFERGWYAGPVGWVNSKGVGEFIVAIRSGLIGEDHARFYAGCGIVADSDAEAEWRETMLKLSPMLSALEYD